MVGPLAPSPGEETWREIDLIGEASRGILCFVAACDIWLIYGIYDPYEGLMGLDNDGS